MKLQVMHADPIRDAKPISKLIQICINEKHTVIPPYSAEEEQQYLENLQDREAIFVAYVKKAFAGFAGISPRWSYSDKLNHCGEIGTWVMPEFRKKGVGRYLWTQGILPWCGKMGFHHLGAAVMTHNHGAIAFYEKMGFHICGYHRKMVKWNNEYIDAVIIERVLI